MIKVKIIRQVMPGMEPYEESFNYDGPTDISIAGLLDYLNFHDDIVNDRGERTARIGWDCSCLQGVCGACAMVINGTPALACKTFIKDLKGTEITLRPLRKFPVFHDLIVDRSSIQENLKASNAYIGKYQPKNNKDHSLQYAAAKCLKCGLCLEVCPNYVTGQSFFGAAFTNDCYLIATRNREKSKEIGRVYASHFGKNCSKSLSCIDVCPMDIPLLSVIAKLNRRR